jgi:hypothetical protein
MAASVSTCQPEPTPTRLGPNFNGADSFTFVALDGSLASNIATVTISVAPVSDAPVASSVVVTTQEGVTQTGALIATDVDSAALTFSVATPPTKGTLAITNSTTGAFTYTPNPGALGYDTFTFQASDGTLTSAPATGMAFIVASSPRWPGQTVRASVSDVGAQGNAKSDGSVLSADGRYIAFQSVASNLVTGDTNGALDVFVRDRETGQTTRVSVASNGAQAVGSSGSPALSADGRYVAFISSAANLVAGDTGSLSDVFVHDRQTGQTERASIASGGAQADGDSLGTPAISADGRFVAFMSNASNLVASDTNNVADVFVRDRLTGQTSRVSVSSSGVQGNNASDQPALSADARYVAFRSLASNLASGDTDQAHDVFVHDRQTGQTTLLSTNNILQESSSLPLLSPDGRYVVFNAFTTQGVILGFNAFLYDRQSGVAQQIRVGGGTDIRSSLSADGRYIAFASGQPTIFVPDDTNGSVDTFVYDRQTGLTTRVSVSNAGVQGVNGGSSAFLSADGRFVAFDSISSNLEPADTNNAVDAFVVGGVSVSPTTVGVAGGAGSATVSVAFDYPGTPWTASTTTPWITINAPAGGSANGSVTFTVASNPGAARTGTVVVAAQVVTVNQGPSTAPVAQNGTFTTPEDTPFFGTLVATDPNGDALTFNIVTQPVRGTVVITNPSTGAFTYTPLPQRFGGDTFTFQASAAGETSNIATVTIDLTPVNDAPFAFDSTLQATEDTPATSFFSTSDSDSLFTTVELVTPPAHGTATIPNPTGGALGGVSYTYTPSPNYNGPDSFTFRAVEAGLNSNVATVTVSVAPVNDAPVASSIVVATQENIAQTSVLLATDVDGDALTFSLVTPPAKGTAAITNPTTGAFTYTPSAGAIGYDTFTVRATDGSGASSTTTGMAFIVASSPRWPGQTIRASVSSSGLQGNHVSVNPVLSTDGRYVVFQSGASNLIAGDTNGVHDVFIRDRETGQSSRVSVASNGAQANGESVVPALSADGRYVAFRSFASNLVAGDTNGALDVFVHDRQTGQTTRVSVASDGTQGNGSSFDPVLSADGRFVAFYSFASNLVPGDTNGRADAFLFDRETSQLSRISVASDGTQGDGDSAVSGLSADGRYAVFYSRATNLVANDTNAEYDVFLHDSQTRTTTRVSVGSDGSQGNSGSDSPAISADGRYVAFRSLASNLVAGDGNNLMDVFVHDRQTGATTRVSQDDSGQVGNGSSDFPSMSADGRYVTFQSMASNLVASDTNATTDSFVYDRVTGKTRRISVSGVGAQSNDQSPRPVLSADGRFIAFSSGASNLVAADTNSWFDSFVVGGVSVSPTAVNLPVTGGSRSVSVSFVYPGTPWSASTITPWITINPPAGGSTNGSVSFTVAPNTGAARTGTLVVALHTITVTQEAFTGVPPEPVGVLIPVGTNVSAQLEDPAGATVPISITFSSVTQQGHATATPLSTPPPSGEFLLKGIVYDISTTATYTPPVTICFTGTFTVSDLLLHYENGTWRDVTTSKTATEICGEVSSLSPFAIGEPLNATENQSPQAAVGPDQVVEATSGAGASVTLAGVGTDPDGDPITFQWTESAAILGTTASISVVMPLGTHEVTLTVADSHGARAIATTRVVVRDTTAPVVTPPAAIMVPATEAAGARGSAWTALAAYLSAGTAVDTADLAPTRLEAQVNGANVGLQTLFAIGKTATVTFRFRDASGNEGRATSTVTVVLGTPKIDVKVASNGTISGTRKFVNLEFTNKGDGNARHLMLNLLPLVPLNGTGNSKLVSPTLPLTLGSLDVGGKTIVRVEYTVPSAVKQLAISEIGVFQKVDGVAGAYVESQTIVP